MVRAKTVKKKNVLLITTDQHRFDGLGYNNSRVQTPNLDRLADRGVKFQNHYCTSPICSPARASILTGLHARSHGLYTLGYALPVENRTLPMILRENGYATAIVGKVHLEALESHRTESFDHSTPYYGFEECHVTEDDVKGEYLEWIRSEHPAHLQAAMNNTSPSFRTIPFAPVEKGRINELFVSELPEELHQTPWITEKAIEYLQKAQKDDRPFFLWCSYVDPHHPWNPPAAYADMYDPCEVPLPPLDTGEKIAPEYWYLPDMPEEEYRRMIAAYYALISFTDTYIGRLLAHLEETGLMDDTIILFTADHGDYNGDKGLIRKLWRLYQGVIHIPLVVVSPGATPLAKQYEGFTQDVDLMPTILDLCGIADRPYMQGVSFANMVNGADSSGGRSYAVVELNYASHPMGKRNWNIALLKDRYKLSYYPFENRFILIDLEKDPYEYHNLVQDEACVTVMAELKGDLLDWHLNTPCYMRKKQYRW